MIKRILSACFRFMYTCLPMGPRRQLLAMVKGRNAILPLKTIRMGELRRVAPISNMYGLDRGQPIDRYYIEKFLERHREDIRGHALEVGSDHYVRKFGGPGLQDVDVLHVEEGHPNATIIGDLAEGVDIPASTYDCFICTQTYQYIRDLDAALRTTYRLLKPGGVLLASIPGISAHQEHLDPWGYYSMHTQLSTQRHFEKYFPKETLEILAYGNVLTAMSFLHGIVADELTPDELAHQDPAYQIVVSIRGVKPRSS